MANHPSAEKRNRQRIKRTLRNRGVKGAVRTLVKNVRVALGAKDKDGAAKALKEAVVALDKAAGKGVLHPKAASRTVSRLSAHVHQLTTAVPEAAKSTRALGGKAKSPKAKSPKAKSPKA